MSSRLMQVAVAMGLLLPGISYGAEICGNALDDDSNGQVDDGCVETCGNGLDDNNNNLADEGCHPQGTTGECESPIGCDEIGSVAPSTGQLVLPEQPDIEPKVPFGPELTLRRTYLSRSVSDSGFDQSLGYGWRHNFMSSLSKNTIANRVVVRLTTSEDAAFTFVATAAGYDYYAPQPGRRVDFLRRDTSLNTWQLRTLDGWIYVYDSSGLLISIADSVGNTLNLTYSSGYLAAVTDASGSRELRFTYSSGYLDKVRVYVNGSVYASTDYTITSGRLVLVQHGTATFREYSWNGFDKLTEVLGAGGESLQKVTYDWFGGGRTLRIESPEGDLGFDYSATTCSGGTGKSLYIAFNHTNDTSSTCDSDGDCGSGNYCGGEGGIFTGGDGVCFRARRCLDIDSPGEDVVTATIASCPSCSLNKAYSWDTLSSNLDLTLRVSPTDLKTSYSYDARGMITAMVENDTNGSTTDVPADGRVTYYFRGNSTYPGLVTEVRKKSELGSGSCDLSNSSGCKRSLTTYTSNGLIDTIQEKGYTLDASGAVVAYDFTTDYDYDAQGRVTEIRGPRSDTSFDNTELEYWASSDKLKDGFLKRTKLQTAATSYLTISYDSYDHWGNPGAIVDPNSNLTCQTFAVDRNILSEVRVTMNGQSTCSSHSSDLVSSYTYDARGNLATLTKPLGNCLINDYDARGRVAKLKDRDDCTATSTGDTVEYTYSTDGQLIKTEYKDSSGIVRFRRAVTYGADRRLAEVYNPDFPTKKKIFSYADDGALSAVTNEDGVGKTEWHHDALRRVDQKRRYRDATSSDDWDLRPSLLQDLPTEIEDEDGHVTEWLWDDLGRRVKQVSAEGGTQLLSYDPSGNVTTFVEAAGTVDEKVHGYSYDPQNRLIAENTGDADCFTAGGAEIQYTYDAAQNCPTGTCLNASGRLAKVKTQVYCDDSKNDDAFDQVTFYGYDAAGRLVQETITDDGGRTAPQSYSWDKNGNLIEFEGPTGLKEKWVRGSMGSNSDADKIVSVQRYDGVITDALQDVSWLPFGPVKGYRQSNKQNSNYIRADFSWDLALRPSAFVWEEETSGTDLFKIQYTKDAQGRVVARDYTGATNLKDSYYTYDWLDRVICDSAAAGTCPTNTADSNLKTSMTSSPSFSSGGDRKLLVHAMGNYATRQYESVISPGSHQTDYVLKSGVYQVDFGWDSRGNRIYDDDLQFSDDRRDYTYDARNNLVTASGKLWINSTTVHGYALTNAYDHKNRRFFKSVRDTVTNKEEQYFFYYDALDRLIEIVHTPDISSSSTYSLFQVFWLNDRPVGMWQVNYPAATSSKRYIHGDEWGRPIELWNWTTTTTRVWGTLVDLFGWDSVFLGSYYQPFKFPGQHLDVETASFYLNTSNGTYGYNRPPLIDNRFRVYDPFLGQYLQADPMVEETWNVYGYAEHDPVGHADSSGLVSSEANGCGPKGNGEYVPELWFHNACNAHDLCYSTCGISKIGCDARFFRNMLKDCVKNASYNCRGWWFLRVCYPTPAEFATCAAAAATYSHAVALVGISAFESAQELCAVGGAHAGGISSDQTRNGGDPVRER
jgi:RHS repeat-associated protein